MADPSIRTIGRYEVIDSLGKGATGSLFIARDPAIDRLVAIKLLTATVEDDEVRNRFAREARSAGRLRHPKIVTIFDVGEHLGRPFIAMEYVRGETLAELIRRRAPLPTTRRLEIIEEVCDGLGHAHREGIIHRDIKPTNIMIEAGGSVKILDFGIARVADSGDTQTGTIIGTVNYMSPEQVQGRPTDQRSDIFAVGALLYELFAHRPAFPGPPHEAMVATITRDPPPLSTFNSALDPAVDAIVGRAMRKKPEDRYDDIRAMGRDLRAVRLRLDAAAPTTIVVPTPAMPPGRPPQDADALVPRRASQIEAHLARAQAAATAADDHAAIAACEMALTLDPEESRALALLNELRQRVDRAERTQQVRGTLDRARSSLEAGAYDAALLLLDDASVLAPGTEEIATLRAEANRVRAERAAAEASRRAERPRVAPPPPGEAGPQAAEPEIVVPVHAGFRFVEGPLDRDDTALFIGRQRERDQFVNRILHGQGTALLITGYRGVGKTSFVNRVIAEVRERLSTQPHVKLLVVRMTIAQRVSPSDLIFYTLRRLAQELTRSGIIADLDQKLRDAIEASVMRTSGEVRRNSLVTEEGGVEFEPAGVKLGLFALGGKGSFKRAKQRGLEVTATAYSEGEAQQDLIAIMEALTSGFARRPSWLQRMVNLIRRRPAPRVALKLLFVFDELDKLEDLNDGSDVLGTILSALKNLFSTPGVHFVFVGGRDLDDRWREDVRRGNSVYESVFATRAYLGCMWSELDRLWTRLVAQPGPGPNGFLNDFGEYLQYVGRGIPRLALRALEQHVEWRDGSPALVFSRPDIRRVRFYSGLQRLLGDARGELNWDGARCPRSDRELLSTYYLVDWTLEHADAEFNEAAAVAAVLGQNPRIAPRENDAPALVDRTLRRLIDADYVKEITQAPGERQLDDVKGAVGRRFCVTPRRLAELGGRVAHVEKEAAVPPVSFDRPEIAGFRTQEKLGEGAMGIVFKAEDERQRRTVAIKLLKSSLLDNATARARFNREIEVLRRLSHPNVVGFVDAGEQARQPYVVMEYVEGLSVAAILANRHRLEPGPVAAIASAVAAGMSHVHGKGFVRNDIKPRNVIIDPSGRVCIIDFGIAKPRNASADLTQVDVFVGTPHYLAPEAWGGGAVDQRADVYALGVMMYETVTGTVPFDNESREHLMVAHVREAPVPPSKRAAVPAALEKVILTCMAKEPNGRYASMDHVMRELDPIVPADAPAALRALVGVAQIEQRRFDAGTVLVRPDELAAWSATFGATAPPTTPTPIPLGTRRPAVRIISGPAGVGTSIPLAGTATLGRAPTSEVRLDSPSISRFHTRIDPQQDGWIVEDLNSSNGTAVNGVQLTGPRLLSHGDRIDVGEFTLEFNETAGLDSSNVAVR